MAAGSSSGRVSASATAASSSANTVIDAKVVTIRQSRRIDDQRPAIAAGAAATVPSTRNAPGRSGSEPGS